jgi:hypothetical protein
MTATLHLPAGEPAQDFDAPAACEFLHSQARWLTHALENAESSEVVGTVLGMHEGSHALWLDLISTVQRAAPAAAEELAGVYGYHGWVVGSLERGLDRRIGWAVRRRVRILLARRLDQLTDDAVEVVEALGEG